jgi:hypothetical protein
MATPKLICQVMLQINLVGCMSFIKFVCTTATDLVLLGSVPRLGLTLANQTSY